jgi:adenylosuccinate lyase
MNEPTPLASTLSRTGLIESARALTPLDGRYSEQLAYLSAAFSEFSLMRNRVRVEVEWFIALSLNDEISDFPALSEEAIAQLRGLVENFGSVDFERIRAFERVTGHDVKAVEYFIKDVISSTDMADKREFVHFCCTSEDINNLAYGLMLQECFNDVWLPKIRNLHRQISELAHSLRDVAFLTRTHGQPATPSTLGKEMAIFAYRLERQLKAAEACEFLGKLNGAVGTFSAHVLAYPDADWEAFARRFVEGFGLTYNPLTTQIEPHDYMAEVFHVVSRVNAICTDLAVDAWLYIGIGYFAQRLKAGEVGSSTMPHKINPIDFENGEANFGLSSVLLNHLASKLAVSRMQRDLSDSSTLRSIGSAFGYACVGVDSLSRGIGKLAVDRAKIEDELADAWEILGEGVQTVMRKAGVENPYEKMKALTRGAKVTSADLHNFIAGLDLPADDKRRLLDLKPRDYIGIAAELVDHIRLD